MNKCVICMLLVLTGCTNYTRGKTNPDPIPVSGTVQQNGNPINDVVLNFQPTGPGSMPAVVTVKDGNFELEMNPGRYTYFFSEPSSKTAASKQAFTEIPEDFQEPSADREVTVEPEVPLELEI